MGAFWDSMGQASFSCGATGAGSAGAERRQDTGPITEGCRLRDPGRRALILGPLTGLSPHEKATTTSKSGYDSLFWVSAFLGADDG